MGYIINSYGSYGGGIGLPLGAIIGLASGYSLPTGFSAYNTYTGRHIYGNSTANGTGGSTLVKSQASDAGTSNHRPGDGRVFTRTGSGGASAEMGQGYLGGSHGHTAYFYHTPKKARLLLMITDSDGTPVPVGGILFGDTADLSTDDSGYSTLNDQGGYLSHETTTGITNASSSSSCSSVAFSHIHHTFGYTSTADCAGWDTSISGQASFAAGPSHSHSLTSVSISVSVRYRILKAFQRVSESKLIGDRTIVMFDGGTVPDGWLLCDGNNSTVNLVGYFVYVASTNMGNTGGNNTGSGSATLSANGSHNHARSNNITGWFNPYSHNANNTHTHSASGSGGYAPPYRTLKFIQYMG